MYPLKVSHKNEILPFATDGLSEDIALSKLSQAHMRELKK
jgi:hypothetical protein